MNTDITREILRAAVDKHAERGNEDAFHRVLRAARGLRATPGRRDPAALHPSLRAQLPGPIQWNDTVRKAITDLTPKHMRNTDD